MSTEDPPGGRPSDGDLDRLLGQLGQLSPAADPLPSSGSPDHAPPIDELLLERLRQGRLGDEQRAELMARLAADPAARDAWVEGAEERSPLEPEAVDHIVGAIAEQREREDLPAAPTRAAMHPGLRVTTWVALAATIALLLLWGGSVYRHRSATTPPSYQLTLAGQLVDTRGTGAEAPDQSTPPVFAQAGTLEITLRPEGAAEAPAMALQLAAMPPDGDARLFTEDDGLAIEQRNGVFVARAPIAELFGDQTGRRILLLVLGPEESRWSEGRLLRWASESAAGALASPDRSATGPGGHRLVVQEIDLQP